MRLEGALTEASSIEPMSTAFGCVVTAFAASRCEILAEGECPIEVLVLTAFGFNLSQVKYGTIDNLVRSHHGRQ